MKKTDQVYLEDVLDAIDKISEFLDGYSYDDFENDEKTIFAVSHALEIIGEASNKLSQDFINNNSDFPMRQAVEMRNFLIHGYDQISPEVVWKTIKEHLPDLRKQVQSLI
ncbi:DUF86 domain-containing protein [Patescibacteria group bacterium]|nr:DUF86 domain-containing protein [Patescibacteria group bacterium]